MASARPRPGYAQPPAATSRSGQHVRDQRQMRAVLLDRADRQDGHALLGDGLADLGPGELFVSKFVTHFSAGASDILYAVGSLDDTSRQFATSNEIRSGP